MEAIFILLVTYVRPSELLALRKIVQPLMSLLHCWSVVIAAFETEVSTKTGVRGEESLLLDQRWPQWVNKLMPRPKAGNSEERIWNFDYLAATRISRQQPTLWNSAVTVGPETDPGAWVQNSESSISRTVVSVQQCRKIRQEQSSGSRPPHLSLTLRHKLETLV